MLVLFVVAVGCTAAAAVAATFANGAFKYMEKTNVCYLLFCSWYTATASTVATYCVCSVLVYLE